MRLPNSDDTIVAISTPPGHGGIGVIRISGREAISVACAITSGNRNLAEARSHSIHHCYITGSSQQSMTDEVLVSVFHAPNSYTGENVIEISAHGNPQILRQIVQLSIDAGCRQAAPGEFTLRAFQNGRIDLLQAEAVADLIAAEGVAFQQAAMYQLSGKLSEYIGSLRNDLVEIGALFEAYTDFPDEDIPHEEKANLLEKLNAIDGRLSRLAGSYARGEVLRSGIQVPIVGPPNAGKSSLFNAILAEERAIVTEIPGTTRDTISEKIDLGGITVRFVDTAGMRETQDRIESAGVERSQREVDSASIIILVFDASTTTAAEVLEFSDKMRGKTIILVLNKIDLLPESEIVKLGHSLQSYQPVFVSARELRGIDSILDRIRTSISVVNVANPGDQNILTNKRHYGSVLAALEALTLVRNKLTQGESYELLAFELRQSIDSLEEILGRVTNEDLLAEIFSRFCIGK